MLLAHWKHLQYSTTFRQSKSNQQCKMNMVSHDANRSLQAPIGGAAQLGLGQHTYMFSDPGSLTPIMQTLFISSTLRLNKVALRCVALQCRC